MSQNSASKPRRSSRQSTPTSPPPSTRHGRSLPVSASTPSFSTFGPPSARKSAGRRSVSPANSAGRPALPVKHSNQLMAQWPESGKLHKVKTQTLHLGVVEGTITIARVKCPVPKGVPGHIIKRFDTDAVSASSLFRAAFPTATDAEEQAEMKWIAKGSRNRYGDTKKAGVEHDESRKLSGTWIPSSKAAALAAEYGITRFATDLIAYPLPAMEAIEIADSDNDSPAAAPRSSKRARVTSPASSVTTSTPSRKALSGVSNNGVTILQTLSTDLETSITTETTEVTVAVPEPEASPNGLAVSDAAAAQQIEQAKALVESLKESGTLPTASSMPGTVATKKRALEEDADDTPLPTTGTLADTRGFFGKLFRRAPARRGVAPITAGREIKAGGSQVAVMERQSVEGRRWIAGIGLAVAVGATAAAPYLFG